MDESFEIGTDEFSYDGVLLKKAPALYITELDNLGTLSIQIYNPSKIYCIEWKANERFLVEQSQEQDDFTFVDTIKTRRRTESESLIFNTATNVITAKDNNPTTGVSNSNSTSNNTTKTKVIRIKLLDIKIIELQKNGYEIKLINNNDNKTHSQYFFQQRNADSFLRNLQSLQIIRQNRKNKLQYDIINCYEITKDQTTQKSFDSLNIDEIKNVKLTGLSDIFVKFVEMIPISQLQQDPSPSSQTTTPTSTSNNTTLNGEYEVLDDKNTSDLMIGSDDSCEMKELNSLLPERIKIVRGSPLSEKQWREFFTEDGRISDVERIKDIIFRGGIETSLRREVWKYMLDYDEWNMTKQQLIDQRKRKTDEYFLMKLQWKSMTKIQEDNFSGYRDRKCQIEKDVKRTDRAEEFFAGDNNPNLDLLQDILMTYCMYNFDLGYVQGMNDLLAPILCIMRNEHDSFWCFVGFMKRVYRNFDIDQAGMKQQLSQLSKLIAFVCPKLYRYLNDMNSENMYFCFRWLLVWFKREFSPSDVLELWETIWCDLPCPNYQLIICVAILEQQMDVFIDNKYEFTDILKHINELSMKLELKTCLENAESIYLQIKNAKTLTDEIRLIIGEEPLEKLIVDDSDNVTDDGLDDKNTSLNSTAEVAEEIRTETRRMDEL